MSERVWITGIGTVSPVGLDRPSFWKGCVEGRSGARAQQNPWLLKSDVVTRIAADVRDFDPTERGLQKRFATNMDRTAQFAVVAAEEALRDAGFELPERPGTRGLLEIDGAEPERVATIVGSGIGGLTTLELSHAQWREGLTKNSVKRYSLPMLIPNSPAGQIAIRFRAMGECKAIATACAAGTMSIGDAWRCIVSGEADVAITGGADGTAGDHDAYAIMGFERLRTLSTRNDEPERASRPFDTDRDGFVLGEGAGILILEREAHARARGVKPYAAVAGYGVNCDAHSMMQLDDSGDTIVALIDRALRSADLPADAVDFVSAHGTSTRLNDKTEAQAIRRRFKNRTDEIRVTALKSMTGHGIGASGPLETAAAAIGFREGVITPTINHENTDPECPVRIVANRPEDYRPQAALKLSYGFGGHNACLVLVGADRGA